MISSTGILLDGPLRPGCIILEGSCSGCGDSDPFGLKTVIPPLMQSASAVEEYTAPQSAWLEMREDGGPFEVGPISIPGSPGRMEANPPAIVSLRVPEGMTNIEVRSRLESAFGRTEGLHFALSPSSEDGELEGAYISKSLKKPGMPEGPPPDPELLKEILGDAGNMDIGPDIEII